VRLGALWVAIVALGHFAGDMYPGFVTPLLPYFKERFHSNYLANSLLPAVGCAGMVLQPVFGVLSDRTRRKHFIVVGIACSAVFYSVMTVMPSLPLVAICIFLGATGVSMFHPQSAALAGRLPGAETGRTMGWFIAGGQTGVAVGMLVAPLILDRLRPASLVWTMPVGILIAGLVLLIPVSPGGRPASERDPEKRLLAQLARAGWPLATLTVFVTLRAFVISSVCFGVPLMLYEGSSLTRSAWPVVMFMLAGTAGVMAGARAAALIGERRLLVYSSLVGAACFAGFLGSEGAASYVMLAALGAVLSCSVPLHVVLGQRALPDNASAASSLMIGVAWGVGGLLLPLIGGAADLLGRAEPALAGVPALRATLMGVAVFCAATAALGLFVPVDGPGEAAGAAGAA